MRKLGAFGSLLLAILAFRTATAAVETIDACNILDPEVHDALDILVYQRNTGLPMQEVRAARMMRLDPTTGAPNLATDGELADDLAPYANSQAGPKFANGVNGQDPERFVAYSRVIPSTNLHVVGLRKGNPALAACINPAQPAIECFPDQANFRGQIPAETPDPGDERLRVYTTEEEDLQYRAQVVYNYQPTNSVAWAVSEDFIGADPSGDETIFDNEGQGIPWARMEELQGNPNKLMVVTVFIPEDAPEPIGQIFLIDTETGIADQITNDESNKFNPFLFRDATTGDNMIVYRDRPGAFFSNIVLLRQNAGGEFDHYLTITAQDIGEWSPQQGLLGGRRYLLSPEPFHYAGVSYILFSSADQPKLADVTDGNVWVARVTNGVDEVRVNDRPVGSAERPRSEAEVYFPNGGGSPVFFYQWQVVNAGDDCGPPSQGYLRNQALARVTGVVLP